MRWIRQLKCFMNTNSMDHVFVWWILMETQEEGNLQNLCSSRSITLVLFERPWISRNPLIVLGTLKNYDRSFIIHEKWWLQPPLFPYNVLSHTFKLFNFPFYSGSSSFSPRPSDEAPSRSMGRAAQLLANVNSSSNGVQRTRGPQSKVFGVPVGTTEVRI